MYQEDTIIYVQYSETSKNLHINVRHRRPSVYPLRFALDT
ncbi:Uncharacterised protein [Porphyromonas cangingivalis]|nr:Uncharacterised protein [Porphyromonas cangingivalis]